MNLFSFITKYEFIYKTLDNIVRYSDIFSRYMGIGRIHDLLVEHGCNSYIVIIDSSLLYVVTDTGVADLHSPVSSGLVYDRGSYRSDKLVFYFTEPKYTDFVFMASPIVLTLGYINKNGGWVLYEKIGES